VSNFIRSKKIRWLLFALIPLLCCGVAPFLVYAYWFDENFGCFGTFYPSRAEVAERANVSFPPSTASLEWQCQPGIEGDGILIHFTIAPSDLRSVTNALSYFPHTFSKHYFFNLFEDERLTEEHLQSYSTYQGNSACGWTNMLIVMDDPKGYTVYAYYQDWDDCSLFSLTVVPLLP
jgi:hypothetical protein